MQTKHRFSLTRAANEHIKIKKKILNILGKSTNNGERAFWLSYVHNRHRLPNFKNPKDLSEICINKVLKGEINKVAHLADKYAVRRYVEEKGLKHILVPLLGIYNNGTDIDFDILPDRFVLKANYGAGYNVIVKDKSTINLETTRYQVDRWIALKEYSHTERHYNLIPRKIICEAFINDGTGEVPTDYKFMCIRGKVHCILACYGREKGHANYLPYSIRWKPLYDYYRLPQINIKLLERPTNLREMVAIAEKLAEDIDFVRIDLYSNGIQIWFGEITLTPAGCIFHRWTNKAMQKMGEIYRLGKNEK